MEFVTACGTSILSTIVVDLVKSTGRQVGYIFRFKSIIEDLNEEAENLRLAQENMQHRVDGAIIDTDEIEKDVEKWLRDVTAVVADAEDLEKQTREMKTCLNGLCPNWIWRYQMARRAQKKISIMSKLKDGGINVLTPKDFMPFESTTYTFNLIIEALKDDNTNVVGLYGMGGVGKTTLAKAVVKKAKEEKIFNEVVMVVVSNRDINEDEDIRLAKIRDIQGKLADFLNLKLQEESNEGRAERLFMRLKNGKKILIILDDIWKKTELADIGIPVDKDCKIFLTTRREQVCIDMGCQSRIQLDVLNEEEGLVLFRRHSGLNDDQSPTTIKLAKEVVEECKGLPLAIVAIGSALKEQPIDEWEIATQKLRKSELMDVDIVDEKLYACLKLSYDYLKNEKTKSCFLLCSLFPEDHEIDMEQLVRYGPGFGLYQNTGSIEDARRELRVMVNRLKASSLLLDAKEGHVKMHDVVHDVALWITSKGEEVFMVKAGMGLTEWPEHEGLEQCTAISLMGNNIEVLPDGLVCPKLKILLLEGNYDVEVSDVFFEEMKTLKVASLNRVHLSVKSLQFLTNLVTLQLIRCRLSDISSIKKLAQLEILRLKGSWIVELPEELGELNKLRMLDITNCRKLIRIPTNVIPRLFRLEELYIGQNSFSAWEVEGTSAEGSNASLSELNKLCYLTILTLCIKVQACLPKDFDLSKLLRYDIRMGNRAPSLLAGLFDLYPKSRFLKIRGIEATSLVAFKALYEKVEYLELREIKGYRQNMVPSIDETGLNELKSLSLIRFDELECIIDTTQQQDVPSTAFSNLVDLSLLSCVGLREICSGGRPPRGFLENLETLNISSCVRMSNSLFPSWMLIQRLRKLKKVTVYGCDELEDVFQLEGLSYAKENPFLLSSLESLHLDDLRNMRYIWKGPTQQVSLRSLTVVIVRSCHQLRYVFTLSLTRSLLQLEELIVWGCDSLEHIVKIKEKENCDSLEHIVEIKGAEENVGGGGRNDVMFPKLKKLQLYGLKNFINFCSENYSSTWPALQELGLYLPLNSTVSFVAQLEQITKEKLRVLEVGIISDQLYRTVLTQLIDGFQNLEELKIRDRRVQMLSQLELSLPSLKKLLLEELEELEWLCKGPTHLLSLPNLKKLSVRYCNRLRHMFSTSLARNMLQLEELSIGDCKELEQFIVEDHTEDDHVQLGLFPNLSYFSVERCDKLKTLFPVTIAQSGLQKLRTLKVENSFQLEELFGHKDEADITSHKEMVLPQLEKLTLQELTSLVNFCPIGYHFIFPSLSELVVTKCPNLTTRFSVDQNRSVYAEVEAPQTGKEDVDMEQSPPKTTKEIYCSNPDSLLKRLPPYIGN